MGYWGGEVLGSFKRRTSFKRKMQDLLFYISIKEDDYVGIPTL